MKTLLIIAFILALTQSQTVITRKMQAVLNFASDRDNYFPICQDYIEADSTLVEIYDVQKRDVNGEDYYVGTEFNNGNESKFLTIGVWVKSMEDEIQFNEAGDHNMEIRMTFCRQDSHYNVNAKLSQNEEEAEEN